MINNDNQLDRLYTHLGRPKGIVWIRLLRIEIPTCTVGNATPRAWCWAEWKQNKKVG